MSNQQDEILILGDSMIQNVQSINNTFVRSYRGDTLEDITNHLRHDKIPAIYDKRIVLLHVGTNDLYSLEIAEMVDDFKALLDQIKLKNSEAKLLVSAILPRPKDFWTTQEKIVDYNRRLIAKQVCWNFTFVHTYSIFQRNRLPIRQMYYEDNIHPSDMGALRMGTTWGKTLKRLREELGIAHNVSDYHTPTVATKKPVCSYNYEGQRVRRTILCRPVGDFPAEPTYCPNLIECHFPKGDPRKPPKGNKPPTRSRWRIESDEDDKENNNNKIKSVIVTPSRSRPY